MSFKNPYTEVVKAEQAKYDLEYTKPVSLADLPETHVKTPDNINKTWGPWSFEVTEYEGKIYYSLYHEAMDYDIDLANVNNTGDVYEWVAHMSAKNTRLYGDGCVYFLCQAFEDICKQSGISLRAVNAEFKGAKIAAKYYKRLQVKRNVSARVRHQILERDGFKCLDCGASPADGALLEIDHTIPISKGGSNDPSNLRTLCSDCNRGKSDRIVQYA
jgi:5-methylcytosine-specific restriction endonuclease McrA